MQSDIQILYNQTLDESHHGFPTVRSVVHSGRRGQPQILIDPAFLAWAYNRRSMSALARFLGIGRTTLRNVLVGHGLINLNPGSSNILHPQTASESHPAFQHQSSESPPQPEHSGHNTDDLLEPDLPLPDRLPDDVHQVSDESHQANQSLHHSEISDGDLDHLVTLLRLHYRRAGIRMLDGMLRRLGHRVQYERIRQSLLRIDPIRRVFERIRIRRRHYNVAGPNALWHHDGQHGMILSSWYLHPLILIILYYRPYTLGHHNSRFYRWLFKIDHGASSK